jgi:hypothetical protein
MSHAFFTFCVFNNAFSTYTISVDWMDDRWIEKNLKGSSHDPIIILSQHLPERIGQNQIDVSCDSPFPSRDSNQAPPEYESRALQLHQPVWCIISHKKVTFIVTAVRTSNSTVRFTFIKCRWMTWWENGMYNSILCLHEYICPVHTKTV